MGLRAVTRFPLLQLRKRFPNLTADVEQQISTAIEAKLELWSERVLDAETVEQVFLPSE